MAQKNSSSGVEKESSACPDNLQIYDPVFILRFSIHCLSMSYIEPTEFASLGLLAVTFVSISSPNEEMRKLGYESLSKFNVALEKCRKKKDVARLRLLLSYLQNGIEEPWQRIPSVISVFVAEASLVLLDPSHGNYSTISKYLMNSPSVNMRNIPLFENFFWSTSVSFRTDRLWMLRLLYAGLNMEDDAQIYKRNSIFEIIFSFYFSPLSDNDAKELIIQIVKKAVKLHRVSWFLVEKCGLIPWLSSIVSSLCGSECHETRKFALTQLPEILKVIHLLTLPRTIIEWLQNQGLEQLSELSSHLYKLLISGLEFRDGQSIILQTITLVLKISQKREIYRPHFTLSKESLFQLCEAVEIRSNTEGGNRNLMFRGLETVLMSTPPANILSMDHEKLLKFLRILITTAISRPTKVDDCDNNFLSVFGKKETEESLVSKLFRWLTASVILGKVSRILRKSNSPNMLEKSTLRNLQSLLVLNEKEFGENCERILAASIFYLLQMLSFSQELLPSGVSALCLLLLSGSSESELLDLGISLPLLCSKIRCPIEANPSWRWSFHQPWQDQSLELSPTEKLDEIHACEKLLLVASKILVRKSFSQSFSPLDLDNVQGWERSTTQSE